MTRPSLPGLLAFLSVVAATGLAAGEDGASLREARERFDRGVSLYDRGDYEAAIAEFMRAHEIAPNHAVLYNIGQTHAQLRRYPEAVASFERYLAEGGTSVPARRREEVERELGRLRALVGRIEVGLSPTVAATVYLDGTEAGTLPRAEPFVVGAGRHEVEVRAEGYLPVRRTVTVAGGAEVPVHVTLSPAGAPGGILVTVAVPGASVLVDDQEVGTSPILEPIAAAEGRHIVEARREGYRPALAAVEVRSGVVTAVELALEPRADLPAELAGRLEVRVDHADRRARIVLDGSPFRAGPLPAGPHLLEVGLEGFEPWSGEVDVRPGGAARVDVALRPTAEYRERYEARARGLRTGSYVMAGVGLAALGTSIGLLVWNHLRYLDWVDERDALRAIYALPPGHPDRPIEPEIRARQEDNDELIDSVHTLDLVGWIVFGVGVAAAATWAGLMFGGPDPDRYSSVALAPAPGGLGLSLAFR